MAMAGHDLPGTPSGFLSFNPMIFVRICDGPGKKEGDMLGLIDGSGR
jgi:hypothetical protein